MWTIIRKYYLFLFILFFVLFSVRVFVSDSPNAFIINLLIALAGAILISLICGSLYYFQDTKWGPNRRKKMFSKSPFTELLQNGFARKDDLIYGHINGYTIIVMYSWSSGKSSIKIDVLFDPHIGGQLMTGDMFKEMTKRIKPKNRFTDQPYTWTKNSIGHEFEYNFRPPNHDKIIRKAETLTEVLALEGLKPMKLEEAEKLSKSNQ